MGDDPSTAPRALRATTCTHCAGPLTGMDVSKPDRGTEPASLSAPADGPARTSHVATSVAPFQLANAVTLPPGPDTAAAAGKSAGRPVHAWR